jgi:hypothetical protein
VTAPTVLTEVLTMTVLTAAGQRGVVEVDLCWSAAAHPELQMIVHSRPPDDDVEWVFARELLSKGLQRGIGDGDVRVMPDPAGAFVQIVLGHGDDRAVLTACSTRVGEFIDRTLAAVPLHAEIAVPEPGWFADGGAR